MHIIKLPASENRSQIVSVGWTGQNEYEEVTFDISKWLKKFPNGIVRVFYRLSTDGNLYPIADITTSTYIWKPQAADFPKPGRYSAQAIMESGTTIGKSDIFYFDIKKSLDHLNQISDDPPPEYPPSYIQRIMQDMEALAERAESAAEHIPYYEDGKLYVWDETTEQFVEFSLDIDNVVEEKVNQYFEEHDVLTEDDLDRAIDDALTTAKASGEFDGEDGAPGPQGPQGEPGKDGKDGQDGAQGPQGIPGQDGADGAPGKDGKDGAQGPAGQDGADGYSPIVAVESITGGNRITITDKNGPHSVDVMNGTDGQDGAPGPQGPAGQDGDDYVLTAQDKQDIANIVVTLIPSAESEAF